MNPMHRWLLFFASIFAGWSVTASSTVFAQSERYELGKRLRRFELAWQEASTEKRAAARPMMQKAVQSFFSLQLSQAASHLDDAFFSVRATDEPAPLERAWLALRWQMDPVTIDAADQKIMIRLKPLYKPGLSDDSSPTLNDTTVHLMIFDQQAQRVMQRPFRFRDLMEGQTCDFEFPEGDYQLEIAANIADAPIALPRRQLSVINDVNGRLEKITTWLKQQTLESQRSDDQETLRLTIRQIAQTIQSQIEGRELETDYPAARWITLAETLMADPSRASEWLRAEARNSLGMVISHHRRSVPIRIHVPASNHVPDGTTVREISSTMPIVFAFHGAGGSENMFFETYGAGRLVELSSQRGWIVVAPRHPLLGMPLNYREMIEALSPFFAIDRERVYLVGHSMGGAEVVRQVTLDPKPPQAAVVIGGGGNVKDLLQVKATPWMIAAGEFDFGRGGAKALATRLEQIDCKPLYREYPNVEHMVIVQAALDDTFEFLTQAAVPAHPVPAHPVPAHPDPAHPR